MWIHATWGCLVHTCPGEWKAGVDMSHAGHGEWQAGVDMSHAGHGEWQAGVDMCTNHRIGRRYVGSREWHGCGHGCGVLRT